ncbi:MAG: N-acetylglucosamine-6-phosphate deacetylase [Clostridia bacterium]|nr:N-acetylglucosamine-6-phosphate deacetylase [Clostridia bacterium]
MSTVIRRARLGDGLFAVTVADNKITKIESEADFATHAPAENEIDAGGARLVPGLIDIHTHGMRGMDTMDGDNLAALAAAYLSVGTTTVYPTTVTASAEDILAVLSQKTPESGGACVPGFHVEGPYVNPRAAGAQDPDYIKNPDIAEFERFPNAAIVTVAPELPDAMDFIKRTGASVAIGHTECDEATAVAAFRAGAKCLTHTCNRMPPLLHRDGGPIGAAILEDAYAQVISDGLHLGKSMVLALYRTFGVRRMILISDSMRATGMPDGQYMLGGLEITVKDGVARTAGGALAGSTATLYDCVQKAISFGIPPEDAYAMASTTPAEMLGLPKGKVEVGYDAEFLLLDEDWRLIRPLVL